MAVLAHDAYLFYEARQEDPTYPFSFSDIGFIWYNYSPETHNQAVHEFGAESWNENIKPALRRPAVIYAVIPAVFMYVVAFIVWLFGLWPLNRARKVKQEKGDFAAVTHKKKAFTYKRK
jgi:hypothetical protein